MLLQLRDQDGSTRVCLYILAILIVAKRRSITCVFFFRLHIFPPQFDWFENSELFGTFSYQNFTFWIGNYTLDWIDEHSTFYKRQLIRDSFDVQVNLRKKLTDSVQTGSQNHGTLTEYDIKFSNSHEESYIKTADIDYIEMVLMDE